MTPAEAERYLDSLGEASIQPGLARIAEALRRLGDPHRRFPHVAVGGTNGKGSTVAFLASIFSAAGLRTGAYTSPHLRRFSERIRVDGEEIPPLILAGLATEVRDLGLPLSYFECATAIAMLHLARSRVEAAVLEAGMGGRWDAVNACDPVLTVLTTVSLDHQRWLGETVEAIAGEKAPLMRAGRPAVIGRIGGPALAVIEGVAGRMGARLRRLGRDFTLETEGGGVLRYRGPCWDLARLTPGLAGSFQLDNAACALAAAEELAGSAALRGLAGGEAARRGIDEARWPARFQVFPGDPPVILDAAHNPAGIAALLASLGEGRAPAWVFSALADKDLPGMARLIAPAAERIFLVPLDHPRAAGMGELHEAFRPWADRVEEAATAGEALVGARRAAGSGGRVAAAGSVVLAGMLLDLLEGEVGR
jgi:dihydrofolate synthase/folylpolyglutamate synthase